MWDILYLLHSYFFHSLLNMQESNGEDIKCCILFSFMVNDIITLTSSRYGANISGITLKIIQIFLFIFFNFL